MGDTYPPEVRSEVMRRVRGRDTGPEMKLRRALFALGARGWRCHRRNLPGKPDIAFGKLKLAVFVDGAFWHGHPTKYWEGRSGPYWDKKIARNVERDGVANEQLASLGWTVLRFWDFEVEKDSESVARKILSSLGRLKKRRR